MQIYLRYILLFGSVILVGLAAGLFFAWSISVIPGTQKVADNHYLATMQAINRAILNPAFYLVFFGSLVFLGLASIYQFNINRTSFWFFALSFFSYLIGTVGVTALGNVPLNDQLDLLNLPDLGEIGLRRSRSSYESLWNRLHLIRTVFAVVAFVLALVAVFTEIKK